MTDDEVVETMRRAVTAVRREGYKAAVIYAVLDGTLLGLVTTFSLTLLQVDRLPLWYPAIAVGAVGAGASFGYRVRRPLVERFEAVNPKIHEALRTARDAIEAGDTSQMARALYADVIDRLGDTSSIGLLDLPRVGVRVALVFAVSLAIVQASVVGVDLAPEPTDPVSGDGTGVPPTGQTPTPSSLQPGDEVLGEPETITPGGEDLSTTLERQAGAGDDEQEREYETGGFGDEGAIEAERAGYAPPDDLENAALIRAYNLRIREEADD